MARPTTRDDLLAAIDAEFDRLMEAVDRIDTTHLTIPGACEEWSVKDLLAHLDAWHEMFLEWNTVGREGGAAEMPAPGYGWHDTPALNEELWRRSRDDGYGAVATRLRKSMRAVRRAVEGYDNDDLFTKKRFSWTGSTSVGSYAVSATSSHYAWASKLIRAFAKSL